MRLGSRIDKYYLQFLLGSGIIPVQRYQLNMDLHRSAAVLYLPDRRFAVKRENMIRGVEVRELSVFNDGRGDLAAIENGANLPFPLKRVFYMAVDDPKIVRAKHATSADLLLSAISGSVTVAVDNGEEHASIRLGARACRLDAAWNLYRPSQFRAANRPDGVRFDAFRGHPLFPGAATAFNRRACAGMTPQAAPFLRIARFREEIDNAISRVLDGKAYVLGPNVEAFETEFASFCGVTHCVGVANGTDALALALRAVGVGPGDEVITAALSCGSGRES